MVVVPPDAVAEHDVEAGERSVMVCGVDASPRLGIRSLGRGDPRARMARPIDCEHVEEGQRRSASRLFEGVARDAHERPSVRTRIVRVDGPRYHRPTAARSNGIGVDLPIVAGLIARKDVDSSSTTPRVLGQPARP